MKQLITIATIIIIFTGCSGIPVNDYSDLIAGSKTEICLDAYQIIDDIISQEKVNDAEAHRLTGFPYLRTNRFLSSLVDTAEFPDHVDAWLEQLIKLDRLGRQIEIMNLPDDSRVRLNYKLQSLFKENLRVDDVFEKCPVLLMQNDLASSRRLNNIIRAASVPDNYSGLKRLLGLYPVTRLAVYRGYQRWKEENLASFKQSHNEISWSGTPVIYLPSPEQNLLDAMQIANIISESRIGPFNIPEINNDDLKKLAYHFSPLFLIDQLSDADMIGRPVWTSEARIPDVDPYQPEVYFRLGFTWFEDIILPQLVYTVWFSERPRDESTSLDILNGRMDGIIWRITVNQDGTPLIADTIHPCGCYHLFFPEVHIKKRNPLNSKQSIGEQIDTPQTLPELLSGERLLIRLAANTHYVQRVGATTKPEQSWIKKYYKLIIGDPIPDIAMRSMRLPDGGHKSLYGTDGIIQGTERGERWLLWTMGIDNPGAMRQWGRHATVFVGKRHFDDPWLLDKEFTR